MEGFRAGESNGNGERERLKCIERRESFWGRRLNLMGSDDAR